MNSFRVYTVEGKHESYNDWWQLEGVYGTLTDALDAMRESSQLKVCITLWKDGEQHERWFFNQGEIEEW